MKIGAKFFSILKRGGKSDTQTISVKIGHNHGTKMRMYFKDTPEVYRDVQRII